MTTERRRFPRETIDGGGRDVPGDRRQRSREPAETHFRNLSDNRPRDGQGNPPLEETALERPANADDPDRLRTRLWALELSLLIPGCPDSLRREHGETLARVGDFGGAADQLEAYAVRVEEDHPLAAKTARQDARVARARLN